MRARSSKPFGNSPGSRFRYHEPVLQQAAARHHSVLYIFRHLGAIGLFFLAILDSSPIPTFGGPDILVAILVVTRPNPWYEYALAATAGSVAGAWLTYHLTRKAGQSWLQRKFQHGRVASFLHLIHTRGTGTLAATTAIPFPMPTTLVFAAAGASDYPVSKFVGVVAVCRAVRYSFIALLADHYGRQVIRVIRHPGEHVGWVLSLGAIVALLIAAGIVLQRRLVAEAE